MLTVVVVSVTVLLVVVVVAVLVVPVVHMGFASVAQPVPRAALACTSSYEHGRAPTDEHVLVACA